MKDLEMEESRYSLLHPQESSERYDLVFDTSAKEFSRIRRQLSIYRTLFSIMTAVYVVSCILILFTDPFSTKPLTKQQKLIGKVPRKIVTFNPDHRFDTSPTEERSIWNSLMPMGTGHIILEHPRKWELSHGMPLDHKNKFLVQHPEAEEFSISMFHQLHCLAMVKSEYMHLLDPKGTSHHFHYGLNLTDHIPHCFDYLRQAIMCAGDTTIEHANIIDGSYDFMGWEAQHECRDYEHISRWAAERRSNEFFDIV